IKGKDDAATGDPAFILTVAAEQFRTEYVFLSPDKYMFDCVNIIAPAGVPVFLDGKELKAENLTFRPIREIQKELKEQGLEQPSDLGLAFGDYSLVGQGKWGVYRLVVSDGVHTATSEKPFGVIAYGYDQYVSYGYPAGMNLEDLKLVTETPLESFRLAAIGLQPVRNSGSWQRGFGHEDRTHFRVGGGGLVVCSVRWRDACVGHGQSPVFRRCRRS
ncbi:MAG: hypothetical protein GXP54_08345, partial [Deltaproteobacteria bacterium]|nr:hypothetical protein [Deltaproteobacteria bacterium]